MEVKTILETDPDKLDFYADHPDSTIRVLVAKNPHTAPHTLERLATDKIVKGYVGLNENTPEETLRELVDERYPLCAMSVIDFVERSSL